MVKRSRRKQVDEEDIIEWEWADGIEDPENPKSTDRIAHTAAKLGKEIYRIGDIVQIQGETSFKWVAVILGLEMNYKYEDDVDRKVAKVWWFSRQQDLTAKKKRKGAHPVPDSRRN
jgi:hypothetical protein